MQRFADNQDWSNRSRGFWSWHVSGIYLLAIGAYAAYAFINFSVVQPSLQQMSDLQAQIASLETNVRELAGQRSTLSATNTVLTQMAEQARKVGAARESLEQMVSLNERLSQQADRIPWAIAVAEKMTEIEDGMLARSQQSQATLQAVRDVMDRLNNDYDATFDANLAIDATDRLRARLVESQRSTDKAQADLDSIDALISRLDVESGTNQSAQTSLDALIGLKDSAERQSLAVGRAHRTLQELIDLEGWLLLADTAYLPRAREVVLEWSKLQEKLSNAGDRTQVAAKTADQLLDISDDLVCRGAGSNLAQIALDDLLTIRQRLDIHSLGMDVSQQRLDQLIDLKDRVLSQTNDLATATENLEAVADLHDQFNAVVMSFNRMRHSIVEILAFEPVFARAMKSLQPLIELGNIRHLSTPELRQVIRSIGENRDMQWTGPMKVENTARANAAGMPSNDKRAE